MWGRDMCIAEVCSGGIYERWRARVCVSGAVFHLLISSQLRWERLEEIGTDGGHLCLERGRDAGSSEAAASKGADTAGGSGRIGRWAGRGRFPLVVVGGHGCFDNCQRQ